MGDSYESSNRGYVHCLRFVLRYLPEVFEMGPTIAQVKVEEVPSEHEDAVQQAADECPVEAIVVE